MKPLKFLRQTLSIARKDLRSYRTRGTITSGPRHR